jgi:hypothetical protein
MINAQSFEARNGFHRAQLNIAESIDALKVEPPPPDNSIANAVGKVADAISGINTTMQSLDHSESDNVVALYAVGFGPHGGVSEHSLTGQWIRNAWSVLRTKTEKPTICDIAALSDTRTGNLENTLRETRQKYDEFVATLSDADIARFLRLAGDVCKKIGPPPSDTNPEPTTA